MKKLFLVTAFLLISLGLFGQEKELSINTRTAQRYVQLAEKKLLSKEWNVAFDYANTGLSYDDSISDLYYIKAAAEYNIGYTKNDVLKLLETTFKFSNWCGYNENGARILYADLLSDVGEYEKSMKVLDREPFIYNSDAEFIRVKNGYRIGTVETLEKARERVFTARRIYPKDSRFINLFFMFEGTYKNLSEANNTPYEIPSIVKSIASDYVKKMPYNENQADGIDIIATMFTDPENQIRLLKAIKTRDGEGPLYAIVALKAGLINQQEAIDMFFSSPEAGLNLELLEIFVPLITDEELFPYLKQIMLSYTGSIGIDINVDFMNEVQIEYERGRAKEVHFDKNSDGLKELVGYCDFGTPYYMVIPVSEKEISYSIYPAVSQIIVGNKSDSGYKKGTRFSFVADDLIYTPFQMNIPSIFSDKGIDFYIPFINEEIDVPTDSIMMEKVSGIVYPIDEKENAHIELAFSPDGNVSAGFFSKDVKYAAASINKNGQFIRNVDFNNDGVFERVEYYNRASEANPFASENDEEAFIYKVFGNYLAKQNVYLEKLEMDINGDALCNYTEEYFSNGGKSVSWDFDGDDIVDIRYIKNPQNGSIYEQSLFRSSVNGDVTEVYLVDEVPVKLMFNNKDYSVKAGFTAHVYWVGNDVDTEEEALLVEKLPAKMNQGVVDIIKTDRASYSVVRMGENYFFWK